MPIAAAHRRLKFGQREERSSTDVHLPEPFATSSCLLLLEGHADILYTKNKSVTAWAVKTARKKPEMASELVPTVLVGPEPWIHNHVVWYRSLLYPWIDPYVYSNIQSPLKMSSL